MAMISKNDFFSMSLKDKIRTLYTEGSFVVAIRYYSYKVNLYLLNNYYVEVFYHHKDDRIERIIPLERNPTRLKFYADQIRLPANLL